MLSIQQDTLTEARLTYDKPDALENLCVLVWSACERHQRGEFLSARQYLDGFAVNQLLSLFVAHDVHPMSDELDPRRHLESRSPTALIPNEQTPEGERTQSHVYSPD